MILGEIFERNARCFGSHPAVLFEGRSLSHRELASRIRRLINALAEIGCKKQDRIAVLSRNCPEYLEIYGAAALAGFIGAGINYRLSLAEQIDILKDAEPSVLVFEPEYAQNTEKIRAALPPSTRFVCIGPATPWALAYEDVLASANDAAPAIRAMEDDTLFLVYTSGTTGKAKGVMLGNGAVAEQTVAIALTHSSQPTDRMLIVMPFYHMGGPAELLPYLAAGASIVLHRTFDARSVLESIQTLRVTAAHLAPTMIQMMEA